MTNKYELAVLYHPDLEIDLEKAAEKVASIVKANGGKIVSEDNWGKRKLAYKRRKRIRTKKKSARAFYNIYSPTNRKYQTRIFPFSYDASSTETL